MSVSSKRKVGIDIGGVIIEKSNLHGNDTNFDPNAVCFVSGAYYGIAELSSRDNVEVWIVSFCGKRREEESRQALRAAGFDKVVPESRWHFTRSRESKGTEAHNLGLYAFVDDTLDVLQHVQRLSPSTKLLLHFRGRGRSAAGMVNVANWKALLDHFPPQIHQ